jgi:hypothetical protein
MTHVKLKKRLINKINHAENKVVLEEMLRLIESEDYDLSVYELSAEQRNAIEEARDQYKKGEILTSEQAEKETDEWLDK